MAELTNDEQAIHAGLTAMAQELSDKYGLQILEISFEWNNVSELRGHKFTVKSISVKMQSQP